MSLPRTCSVGVKRSDPVKIMHISQLWLTSLEEKENAESFRSYEKEIRKFKSYAASFLFFEYWFKLIERLHTPSYVANACQDSMQRPKYHP